MKPPTPSRNCDYLADQNSEQVVDQGLEGHDHPEVVTENVYTYIPQPEQEENLLQGNVNCIFMRTSQMLK